MNLENMKIGTRNIVKYEKIVKENYIYTYLPTVSIQIFI